AAGKPSYQPPAGVRYPVEAEWTGKLSAPAYGIYQLSLRAPAGTTLQIDGRTLLRRCLGSGVGCSSSSPVPDTQPPTPAGEATAAVVLARGIHDVRLAGTLGS